MKREEEICSLKRWENAILQDRDNGSNPFIFSFLLVILFITKGENTMNYTDRIYVKLDDGRTLWTYEYTYDELLKFIDSHKYIYVGNETVATAHIVSIGRD